MADLTDITKSCECQQFENCDPCQKPPTDQETRKHYIKHGAIQPCQAFRKQKAGHFELNGKWYKAKLSFLQVIIWNK